MKRTHNTAGLEDGTAKHHVGGSNNDSNSSIPIGARIISPPIRCQLMHSLLLWAVTTVHHPVPGGHERLEQRHHTQDRHAGAEARSWDRPAEMSCADLHHCPCASSTIVARSMR